MAIIEIDGHSVELSSTEKVMFPEDGLTKGDLIEYYRRISEIMLPFVKDRVISMQRFPDGIDGEGFYQKEVPDYFPEWVSREKIEKREGGAITQVICQNAATLVYLANQACITPHIWLSRVDNIEKPDRMIFDLDPSGNDFATVREGALMLRKALDQVGLDSFVMTTGSRGLHVVVPLDASEDFDTVRSFARKVARYLTRAEPKKFTTEQRKEKRGGKLFVDTLRNAYAQTGVPPYAVRARPGAPVAAPLSWDELKDRQLHPRRYGIKNIFRRLGQKTDPWEGLLKNRQSLGKPRGVVKEMISG